MEESPTPRPLLEVEHNELVNLAFEAWKINDLTTLEQILTEVRIREESAQQDFDRSKDKLVAESSLRGLVDVYVDLVSGLAPEESREVHHG